MFSSPHLLFFNCSTEALGNKLILKARLRQFLGDKKMRTSMNSPFSLEKKIYSAAKWGAFLQKSRLFLSKMMGHKHRKGSWASVRKKSAIVASSSSFFNFHRSQAQDEYIIRAYSWNCTAHNNNHITALATHKSLAWFFFPRKTENRARSHFPFQFHYSYVSRNWGKE